MRPSHATCFIAGLLCFSAFDERDTGMVWMAIGAVCVSLWCMVWERGA